MAWVIGIIILILLVASAGFRKFAGGLILVVAVGGLLFWQYQENEEKKSKNRVTPSELIFEGVSLKSSYGSSYDIVGRITNTSNKYTVKGVQLKLTFRDCEKENKSKCIIVAEENENLYVSIPPNQARDFSESVYLYSDLNIKGELVWDYKVEYAKAE